MSDSLPGVYPAKKKDGTAYFRASLTFKRKHISLGSFDSEKDASRAYEEAVKILRQAPGYSEYSVLDHEEASTILPFAKWVALINARDNGIYCNGPIYLHKKYFDYYLDLSTVLRFSAEDLFYYTHHNIQRRGNHLFVADYGMQVSVLSRYGVKAYAIKNRDYYFKNGDESDFRAGNVVIVNGYVGVYPGTLRGANVFSAIIHLAGSDHVIGHYDTEREAAIAYNKAADILKANGFTNEFRENYIEDVSTIEYKLLYDKIRISKRIRDLNPCAK